jgi:hypothetical protein
MSRTPRARLAVSPESDARAIRWSSPWVTPMADWREQEAVNETIFRDMNEWTEEASDARLGLDRAMDTYLCECSDGRCAEAINLTRSEYEAIRAVPVRFAIALNHENPEIDGVTSENPRFATVDKLFAAGAKIARATNPRR